MSASIDSIRSSDLALLSIGEPDPAGGGNDDGTIGRLQFGADAGPTPEPANRTRMKQVADFFVNQSRNLASGPGKFAAYVHDKLPPRFGGTSNTPVEDNSRNGVIFDSTSGAEDQPLSPFDKNVQTLDAMTTTETKIPRQIANKIALSPTLMAKLENYQKAGWTLEFHPGSDMPNTGPGIPEIDDTKMSLVFSNDEALKNSDAFLRSFTQIILYNEGDMLKMQNEEDVFEANVSREMMDKIEAEWSGAGPLRPSEPSAATSQLDNENIDSGTELLQEQRDRSRDDLNSLSGETETDSVFEPARTRSEHPASDQDRLRPGAEMTMDEIEALSVNPRDSARSDVF